MNAPAAVMRQHAEHQYAEELAVLAQQDQRERPPNWRLSPWAVVTYLMGGRLDNGFEVSPKYIGSRRLMEIAVATLATDRALLLYGVPGTAKSWVSEHLAAAVSGDSTLLVQGTAGTSEEQLRYGWNYAQLLAQGPSEAALVPSPLMQAMRRGQVARVEELTRIPCYHWSRLTFSIRKLSFLPKARRSGRSDFSRGGTVEFLACLSSIPGCLMLLTIQEQPDSLLCFAGQKAKPKRKYTHSGVSMD